MSYYPASLDFHPVSNPRDKYLAALARAKAAEAEYLAAEKLQQEEDALRRRLDHIQSLKYQNAPRSFDFGFNPSFSSHYAPPAPQYPQPQHDLERLRAQIAAEERARLAREQETQQAYQREQEKLARKLEALQNAHVAREQERQRALAAQRARLVALTQRALVPTVRFVDNEEPVVPRHRHHHRHNQCHCEPETTNNLALAPFVHAATPRKVHKEAKRERTATVDLQDVLNQLFGAQQEKPKQKANPVRSNVSLEQVLNHFLGGAAAAPEPKTEAKPEESAPISLDQLLSHFLNAAGVEVAQPSTSATTTTPKVKVEKEVAPAPAVPQPAPSSSQFTSTKPAAAAPTPAKPGTHSQQPVGFDQVLNNLFSAAGVQPEKAQADAQQLMNMLFGVHAPKVRAVHTAEASSSKSAGASSSSSSAAPAPSSPISTLKQELEAHLRAEESSEDQDLAEAIRMSLADLDTYKSSPKPDSESSPKSETAKGKAPAPAPPVKDVATSAAEISAIDASFTALANEFVFPADLEFSTSRASSPARFSPTGGETESIISRLSYGARNQPVRYYHQALSGLLSKLDAVESFGDEGVRHARKEVVGRVEGALDEVEKVIEARWRKFVGKEERKEEVKEVQDEVKETASPVETKAEVDEAPVVFSVEEASSDPVVEEPASPVEEPTPAAEDSAPVVEAAVAAVVEAPAPETTVPTVTEPASPVVESAISSYPPAPASSESVETIRPYDVSPAPEIDTFLLPASASEDQEKQKKKRQPTAEEDVGSDWSEVESA